MYLTWTEVHGALGNPTTSDTDKNSMTGCQLVPAMSEMWYTGVRYPVRFPLHHLKCSHSLSADHLSHMMVVLQTNTKASTTAGEISCFTNGKKSGQGGHKTQVAAVYMPSCYCVFQLGFYNNIQCRCGIYNYVFRGTTIRAWW